MERKLAAILSADVQGAVAIQQELKTRNAGLQDIFAVQDEVTQQIVGALKVTLSLQ